MPYPGFTKEGTVDESAILVGSWSEVLVSVSAVDYQIGNVPEGQLEIGREFYEHVGTSFPRRTDLVVPTRVWMKFTGTVEEIHKQNVNWLVGGLISSSNNYIYVGQLTTVNYFTFLGKRTRVSDGVTIEFKMFKCMVRSLFSLASGDEAQGSPLEVEGLSDESGDYGGSTGAPIGWIWVPDEEV